MAHESTPLLSQSASTSSGDSSDETYTNSSDNGTCICGPHKALAVLSGHAGAVSCLALCGEFLLSASSGHDIAVWQQPDLRLIARFGAGSGSVKSLIAVGSHVFSAHQDSRVRVWKLSRDPENVFKLAASLPTRKDYLGNCLKQSNYVQTRRHHRKLWIEHADTISCLAARAGLVYSGSWDKTLKVWRVADLKCLESITAHHDAINALAAAGDLVYSASADGTVKIWASSDGSHRLKACLESGWKGVCWNALVVCEQGRGVVYAGGSDGRVMGWEEEGGQWRVVCDVRGHEKAVLSLCSVGEFVLSGSADRSIGVWRRDRDGGLRKAGLVWGHEGPVKCLQAAEMGSGRAGFMVYSGGMDRNLRVWWVPKDYGERKEEQGIEKCVLLLR